jgi:hypothetical protein
MLTTPAPYPNPGSWALFGYEGETRAVRILETPDSAGLVPIAIGDKPVSASGNLRVQPSLLLDPTPLDSAERAEMAELAAYISARKRPAAARVDRFNALHERQVRAATLVGLLGQLERRRLATPASREARRVFEAALAEADQRIAA